MGIKRGRRFAATASLRLYSKRRTKEIPDRNLNKI
nr:MAG TPA: hypothetical protein [Caudoviricetes sp.]